MLERIKEKAYALQALLSVVNQYHQRIAQARLDAAMARASLSTEQADQAREQYQKIKAEAEKYRKHFLDVTSFETVDDAQEFSDRLSQGVGILLDLKKSIDQRQWWLDVFNKTGTRPADDTDDDPFSMAKETDAVNILKAQRLAAMKLVEELSQSFDVNDPTSIILATALVTPGGNR
jgi:hypothetical protein